jgi:hypothetical protein
MSAPDPHAALEAAEQAHAAALAEASDARHAFESDPTPKTHARTAVAEQRAKNTLAPVEAARLEVERVRRADVETRLRDAVARANHGHLYERTAAARARLVEMFSEVSALVAEIESAVTDQHRGVSDAEEIARELGVHSGAPRKIAPTFLRQMVGIVICEIVYRTGETYRLGAEPHTWIAPRAEPPSAHPSREEWRAAKRLVLPDAYLPPPVSDFHHDAADTAFFHTPTPNGRLARHEVQS